MTLEELQAIGDEVNVSMAARAAWQQSGDRLEPRLWDALRQEMQKRYRRATGEEFAVLTVVNNPEAA